MGNKILLVDESVTVQKIITLAFSDEGVDVVTLGDGEEAIARLQYLRPALVLADVSTPGKNGYEVCDYIKHQESLSGIPVVLLVPAFETYNEERARQVGADLHLTKPFQSIRSLVATVKQLMGSPVEEQEAIPAPAVLEVEPEDLILDEGHRTEAGGWEEVVPELELIPAVEGQDRVAELEVAEGVLEEIATEQERSLAEDHPLTQPIKEGKVVSPLPPARLEGELKLAPEVIDEIVARVVVQVTEALTGRISEAVAARISDLIVAVPAAPLELPAPSHPQERLPFPSDGESLLELDEL
ncbi:MAG: response regulator [Blastocatellia bacterium]